MQKMVSEGLALIIAVMLLPAGAPAMMCHDNMGDMKHEEKKAEVEAYQVTLYICPMHPEVRQDTPGNCSKCGMGLEQKQITKFRAKKENKQTATYDVVKSTDTNTAKGSDNLRIKKESKETALYACPMHPEVTSDKPGKCPKCSMKLKKT